MPLGTGNEKDYPMNIIKLPKSALVVLCTQNGLCAKGTIPVLRERLLGTGEFWMLKFVKTKVTKKREKEYYKDFTVQRQQSKLKNFD